MAPLQGFFVSGFREGQFLARLERIKCVLSKSGVLISNFLSVLMLSEVYFGNASKYFTKSCNVVR